MNDQARPSFQAENFRPTDASPIRDAAIQAYTPENQAIFRIDITSNTADAALPNLQINFEQPNQPGQFNLSINESSNFNNSNNSNNLNRFDMNSGHAQNDMYASNPWQIGNGGQSSAGFENSNGSSEFQNFGSQNFTNDQTYGSNQNNDGLQWLSSNSGSDLSAAKTPEEFLDRLFASFQHNSGGSLDSTSSSSPLGNWNNFTPPPLPTPGGLPSPSDLLSGLPTPPGLPNPGDLLKGLPTPPGLPNPGDLLSNLPKPGHLGDFAPPGLPTPNEVNKIADKLTPPGLPKPSEIAKILDPFSWF